jgi:CHAD domain-containing protein
VSKKTKRKKKRGGKTTSAHDLVKPSAARLVERIRAAAIRVTTDRNDDEGVHDFRVGLRRLRTVLRASRGLYGKRRMRELEARFKQFGDATNALRDAEVLTDTVVSSPLVDTSETPVRAWLEARRRAADDLRDDAIRLLRDDVLAGAFEDLRVAVHKRPDKDMPAHRFAARRLAAGRAGVAELLPIARDDVAGLHRLRIRFKRLRYTAEMLERFMKAVKGGKKRKNAPYARVAKHAQQMQKELGLLHDADVALETVAADGDLAPEHRAALTTALLELRGQLVDRCLERLSRLPDYCR